MKFKSFVSLAAAIILGGMSAINAQGYQDGVDNFNAGRADVAKTILNNTLNDASTDKAVSLFYLGQIAFNEKDLATAEKYFTQGTQANPLYAPNLVGLGEIALAKGDTKGAEEQFKAAQKIDKKDAALTAQIARAYWNVDPAKYDSEIQKYITQALKTSKNREAAVFVLQADMAANEDPGSAASLYEMAITMDGDKGHVNREAYVKYAQTYFRVNPSFAINKLKELSEKEPESALAQRELAEKYYENNQFGNAYLSYKKYIANPNHFQADEQRLAGLAFSAGENQESINLANQVLAKDPQNPFMYRVLLLNYDKLDDTAKAEEAGRKLFEYAKPDQLIPNDYVLYSNALSAAGKYPEAIALYQKAIELNPDNADLFKHLSDVYDKAGEGDLAVETMKKYLDTGNGSLTDFYKMATIYNNQARADLKKASESVADATAHDQYVADAAAAAEEGLKYIDKAIADAAPNPSLYRMKGNLILAKNNYKINEEAAVNYQTMLDVLNQDPENKTKRAADYRQPLLILGQYYSDIDPAQARRAYQELLTIIPDEPTATDALKALDAAGK